MKKIALSPAYQIAALPQESQNLLYDTIESEQATPSLSQAQRIRKLSQSGKLNEDSMLQIMMEQKKPERNDITLSGEKSRKYFPDPAPHKESKKPSSSCWMPGCASASVITADDNSIFPQPDKPSCQAIFISKQRKQHPALYIRNYTYSAEDVDCRLCTEVVGRKGCRQDICPYLPERIEAGVISYGEALLSLIPPTSSIRKRLPGLIHRFPGSLWADKKHKTRMEVFCNRLGYIKSGNTPSYYAVLYLLTSNDALYRRTANCFHYGGIDFSYAVRRGISPHNYALLYAAKGLRHEKGVTESELADPEVIDEEAFRLIMNALLIAKYGTAAFHLKGDFSHEP